MFHRAPTLPLSRRDALARMGAGFGTLSLASLMAGQNVQAATLGGSPLSPRAPHFPAKAKHVIQLFMPGGPSHVDTFDYKPAIKQYEGQRPAEVDRRSIRNTKNGLFPSPFGFKQYGKCG